MQVRVHPEAMAWAPDPADQVAIDDFLGRDCRMPFCGCCRGEWLDRSSGETSAPHAFRAVTRGSNSYVFVDDTDEGLDGFPHGSRTHAPLRVEESCPDGRLPRRSSP